MKSVVRDRDLERLMDRSVRFFFEIQNISSRTHSANELIDRQRERIKPGKKVVIIYLIFTYVCDLHVCDYMYTIARHHHANPTTTTTDH